MTNTLIDPQIMSATVINKTKKEAKSLAVAYYNDEIAQTAGSTLTKIKFAPLDGDAQILEKGDTIDIVPLTQTPVNVTVKQAAIGGEIYDIEVASSIDKTVDVYKTKLSTKLANAIDASAFDNFAESSFIFDASAKSTLTTDVIFDAKAVFGDSVVEEDLYLYVSPKQFAEIEKEDNGRALSRLETVSESVVKGRYAGVNIIVSNKVITASGVTTNYLVRKNAIEIGIKKDLNLEEDRVILEKKTIFAADTVFYTHLAEEDGVVKIKVAENEAALTAAE